MKFKCKIADPQALPSSKGKFRKEVSTIYYEFSKRKVYFKIDGLEVSKKELSGKFIVHWGQPYELKRLNRDDFDLWSKDAKFQAIFNDQSVALVVTVWNGILLRITHNRYWVQRNADWIFKAVITTLIGAFIGLLAHKLGYDEGFKEGSKVEKANTQESRQR